ncbi:MAG: hypothetical protein LBT05_05020 [Planctomycetaceae bacterium]|nr:hypothetical protein [Planctomycetaceae bacterium]
MTDFFPIREALLLEWFKNFSHALSENASAWNVPPAEITSQRRCTVSFLK